jgi:hypothetical protein
MKTALAQLLKENQEALSKLPPRKGIDSMSELLALVDSFVNQLRQAADGEGVNKTFIHRNKGYYAFFKSSIRRTALDFRPFENPNEYVRPEEPDEESTAEDVADLYKASVLIPEKLGLYDVRKVIKRFVFHSSRATFSDEFEAKRVGSYPAMYLLTQSSSC